MKVLGKKELIEHFKELGLKQGDLIEVHSSLSSFGYIVGGSQTVVDALMECVGYNGTILMPLQCLENSEPSTWINPKVHPNYIKEIRTKLPAFDSKSSNVINMGEIIDNFRRRDNTIISNHPNKAFIAWGKYSKLICNYQSSNFAFSMESPPARLYELKGKILLLGVNYDSITSLHLAEYYGDYTPIKLNCAMVNENGFKKFKKFLDIEHNDQIFNEVGKILESQGFVKSVEIGNALCRLLPFNPLVDLTVKYIRENSVLNLYR